jgi:hypothetical protein
MAEWFREWFGEEYLALYPHRDSADAERLVALLRHAVSWDPGWRVLDVACGRDATRGRWNWRAHPVGSTSPPACCGGPGR